MKICRNQGWKIYGKVIPSTSHLVPKKQNTLSFGQSPGRVGRMETGMEALRDDTKVYDTKRRTPKWMKMDDVG